MIEDVYVFDHYKDDLYVIATNQFSLASQEQLEARVENNIKDSTIFNRFIKLLIFNIIKL